MAVKGLTVKKSEISQEIDLEDLTGVNIGQDPVLRRAIAQDIIDYMKRRVQDENLGVGRKPWKVGKYSEEYQESLDFQAAGKSSSDVDMTLTGDMLGSIDLIDESGSKIKIGIADDNQLLKAYGHMTGFEGHPTIPAKFKREFFGITPQEIEKEILPTFRDEIDSIQRAENDIQGQLIDAIARRESLFNLDINLGEDET